MPFLSFQATMNNYYNKRDTVWGTLRKEGAPRIYIWLLFGLWCHNPMLAIIMDIIFLFAVFETSKFVEKLLTFTYNEYILI